LKNKPTAQIVATVQKCPLGALSMVTKEA
jgi:uncharacterized Fe-S cluster protein YjdI